MDSIAVDRDDIEALAQALDSGTLPAADLLRCLVTAILGAAGDGESISVSVEVETVQDAFDAAFVPEPAADFSAAVGHGVRVTVAKIGR
jgi:hypothetical protein